MIVLTSKREFSSGVKSTTYFDRVDMEKQVGLYKIIIILKCGVSRGSGATFKLLYKQNIILDFQKRLFFE